MNNCLVEANVCSVSGKRVFGRIVVRRGDSEVVSIGTSGNDMEGVGVFTPLYEFVRSSLIYLITPYLPTLSWSASKQFDLCGSWVEGFNSLVDFVRLV